MSSYKDQGARSSLAAGRCRLWPLVGELAVRTRPTPGCFALSAPAPSRSSAAGETLCESRRYGADVPPGAEKRCGRPGHCTVSSAQRRRGAGRHLWPGPGSAAAGGGTAPRPGPRPGRGVGSEEALGSGGLPALRVWVLQEGLGTEVGLC